MQHANAPLDGDMADTILPSPWFQKVLGDPFGLSAFLYNEVYAAPNRFFVHWAYSNYFKVVPAILQNVVDPVDSVYIACAIAKTAIQVALILLLAAYISGKKNVFSKEFLIAAVLVAPFFIAYQYWRFGIISAAMTVTIFYPFPLCLLLLFFLPFFKKFFYGEAISTNFAYRIYLALLAVVICLSGVLIPGVVLIVCPAVLLNIWYSHFKEPSSESFFQKSVSALQKIPKEILFYFVLVSVLSLYSLYIGRYNSENTIVEISLLDRYLLLPNGFIKMFTQLFTLLVFMIAINAFLIRKYFYNDQSRKILRILKWIVICSIIYILLLPFGGYRVYRPDILSYDTVMPVTLSLMLIFGLSAYFLIFNLSGKFRIAFSSVIILYLLFYCYQNKSTKGSNQCERDALYEISKSKENIVLVSSDCTVMSWEKIKDYKNSELNAELLKYWGVTKEIKLYYQK